MAVYKTYYPCPMLCNKEAVSGLTEHEVLDLEKTSVRCLECGHKHEMSFNQWVRDLAITRRPRKVRLTKYPRFCHQSGEIVHSQDHQDDLLKSKGFKEHDKFVRDVEKGNES